MTIVPVTGFRLLTCPQWGARRPKSPLYTTARAVRILFHHTAGHHPEIDHPADESDAEAIRYARQIQAAHMAPGGLGAPNGGEDSGHNFLVCRSGLVLQGRWLTVTQIELGQMVWSAHCPGQNNQIGIEHEHAGAEPMTAAQREASAQLQAWIARCYRLPAPLPVFPHRRFFATACPANLAAEIPWVRQRADAILHQGLL